MGLSEKQRGDPDAWIAEAFGWRWPHRYLLGLTMLAALVAAAVLIPWRGSGSLWWLPLALGGMYALYALAVMREVLFALLALAALWVAWYFVKDFSGITWAVIVGVAFFGYIGHLQDQATKHLQKQIDNLQRQINRLSGDPWT